jgi:hypothetical protein
MIDLWRDHCKLGLKLDFTGFNTARGIMESLSEFGLCTKIQDIFYVFLQILLLLTLGPCQLIFFS